MGYNVGPARQSPQCKQLETQGVLEFCGDCGDSPPQPGGSASVLPLVPLFMQARIILRALRGCEVPAVPALSVFSVAYIAGTSRFAPRHLR